MKLNIVIPAYNEANRIQKTLRCYADFFSDRDKIHDLNFELLVVLNGCTDNTLDVVRQGQKQYSQIQIINLQQAGKGRAIIAGFKAALAQDADFIGFVDADMATRPEYFYELVKNINNYDGVIASRYMKGARLFPDRPFLKKWIRIFVFNPLAYILFRLPFKDLQCGAKLFKRRTIEASVAQLITSQWAFDTELLYICKKIGFNIKEIPTTWYDQADSKFSMWSGLKTILSLFVIRFSHLWRC